MIVIAIASVYAFVFLNAQLLLCRIVAVARAAGLFSLLFDTCWLPALHVTAF